MMSVGETFSNLLVMGKSGAGKQPRIDVLTSEFGLKQLSTGDLFRGNLKKFNAVGYAGDIRAFFNPATQQFKADEAILCELGIEVSCPNAQGILLGLKAKFFMESGMFVPDSITNAMFEAEFVANDGNGLVLDGFPRTVAQAEFLLELAERNGSSIDGIVLVDNDDDLIVKRTVGRRICPKCKKVYHLEHKPPRDGKYCYNCGLEVVQRSDDHEDNIRKRLTEFQVKAAPAIEFLKSKGIPVAVVPGNLPVFTERAVRDSVLDALKACFPEGSLEQDAASF